MARRVSEPLRNLDDSLRVFHVLTFRSCGLVMAFFSLCHGLEWQFRTWSILFGSLSFAFELAVSGGLALVLAWIERHDDEHYVPSAVRFYANAVFERVAPRLLARWAAAAILVYIAVDTVLAIASSIDASFAALPPACAGLAAAAYLATRQWPPFGPIVFSAAAASAAQMEG
jgi:hypothetical protein